MNPADTVTKFEVKGNPVQPPVTKIVEAFGDRKCSKLVEQVADANIDVRVNALEVLCDEMLNPLSIFGVAQAGAVPILAAMCNDGDYTTRLRASKALSIMSTDANGLNFILGENAIEEVVKGMYDPSEAVRRNIYTCIMHTTRTAEGVEACVYAGVTERFASCLPQEIAVLKPLLLRTLHNMCATAAGLENALHSEVVKVCIDLLSSSYAQVRADAGRTLGFICFAEPAKAEALNCDGVSIICKLLQNLDESTDVRSSLSLALMAITTTDEGKRQMNEKPFVEAVTALLYDEDRVVKLNALKIIANIAVYPAIREILLDDNSCTVVIKRLVRGEDELITKHAKYALAAVLAVP